MNHGDYRFTLLVNGQFGDDGPKAGSKGIAQANSVYELDDEDWYKCHFPGYEGWYWLPERLMRWHG